MLDPLQPWRGERQSRETPATSQYKPHLATNIMSKYPFADQVALGWSRRPPAPPPPRTAFSGARVKHNAQGCAAADMLQALVRAEMVR